MYLVKCEKGGPATAEHPNFQSASEEAYRLSKLHPGKKFHVLCSVGHFEVPSPTPIWTTIPSAPKPY